ncbi:hypothetical protein HYC85_012908 [Camellia sinensis]|uniref:Glutaredoxin-dependent peroxiredoxin n=1 Tax=Camellia sinensis TaxID=4442 RepID=A0A7J7HE45_CAMSI|nr:hypothetical protein HYC85_012908 [Camellia sinensis]
MATAMLKRSATVAASWRRAFASVAVGTDLVSAAPDVSLQKARSWDEGVASKFATTPLKDIFKDKKVVIFGLPGAFTGVCSAQHVPSYKKNIDKFKGKGIDHVICVAVNDPYTMNGWAEKIEAKDASQLEGGVALERRSKRRQEQSIPPQVTTPAIPASFSSSSSSSLPIKADTEILESQSPLDEKRTSPEEISHPFTMNMGVQTSHIRSPVQELTLEVVVTNTNTNTNTNTSTNTSIAQESLIEFYGDFDGSFNKSLDLGIDLSAALLGHRSHRWSAYVVDGKVKVLNVEKAPSEFEVSGGDQGHALLLSINYVSYRYGL